MISVVANSAARSEAAANIVEARNILREAGLPAYKRNEIIRSFELETFRVERVATERVESRFFDDNARGRRSIPSAAMTKSCKAQPVR